MKNIIKRRLRAYYDLASAETIADGKQWYANAHQFAQELSDQYDIHLIRVCGVISALSVAVRWGICKQQAESLIKAHAIGQDLSDVVISTYKPQLNKAIRVLEIRPGKLTTRTSILKILGKRSYKTWAFFENILFPSTSANGLTVDRWIYKAAGFIDTPGVRKIYTLIEHEIREIAYELNILPIVLQAIIWLSVQESVDIPDFVLGDDIDIDEVGL